MLASLWRMARRDGEDVALVNAGDGVREALALLGAQAILATAAAETADA